MEIDLHLPILPPSENKIRIIRVIRGRVGGIAYTRDATDFKKEFKSYIREHYLADIQNFAKEHNPYCAYKVKFNLYFAENLLINKSWPKAKTYVKKMDIGNRRKLLEDCLSEVLGIDDSFFFELHMTKRQLAEDVPCFMNIKVQRLGVGDYGIKTRGE